MHTEEPNSPPVLEWSGKNHLNISGFVRLAKAAYSVNPAVANHRGPILAGCVTCVCLSIALPTCLSISLSVLLATCVFLYV